MIRYEKGDLLQSNLRIIAHGVNCQGKMGAGIAKQIKEKYPNVYNDYTVFTEMHSHVPGLGAPNNLMGQIVITETSPQKLNKGDLRSYILSAYTQETIGREFGKRYISYDAIDDAMASIGDWLEWYEDKYKHRTAIGMPKIGAGLGGGCWEVIEQIINNRLKDNQVYIYEL